MDKLPGDARALLDQARHADDPTPRERWNADAAVRVALDLHGVRDLPPLTSPAETPPSAARAGYALRAGLAVKLGFGLGAAALLALSAVGLSALLREDAAPGPSAPPAELAPSVQPAAAAIELAPAPPDSRPDELAPVVRHAPRKTAHDASLATELRWLARVDTRIRDGAFERALQLLDNAPSGHARLLEERQALRVLALCGRDVSAQALRERERFLQTSPRSVLAARVRAACGGAP
jgi:hypothetical protein